MSIYEYLILIYICFAIFVDICCFEFRTLCFEFVCNLEFVIWDLFKTTIPYFASSLNSRPFIHKQKTPKLGVFC